MENKFMEIRKKDLQNKIDIISEKIRYNTDKQTTLLEYNQYARNTHIGIGIIIAVTTFFITKKAIDIDTVNSILLTLLATSSSALTTKMYSKHKQNKLKKQNPNINFEKEDIDKNYEKINDLFEQKYLLVEELGSINTEINKTEKNEIKIEPTQEKQEEIIKVKTLKKDVIK